MVGYVRNKLNKLTVIRADLVRTDDDWQERDFPRFIEALRKWTERNPIDLSKKAQPTPLKKEKLLQTIKDKKLSQIFVYCDNKGHRSSDCKKVIEIDQRKIH